VILVISSFSINVAAEIKHLEVILDVQRDGMVIVTHIINVTEPCVYIEVEALAKPLEPILAVGKEVYDASIREVKGVYLIRIYTPDVGLVNLTYVTDALVRKELPNLWIMNFSCKCKARVILPVSSIPVKIPENFTDLYETDNRYVVLLPPGNYEVSWILKAKLPVLIPKAEILEVKFPKEVNSEDELVITINVKNSGNASSTIFIRIIDKSENKVIFYNTAQLALGDNRTFKVKLSAPKVCEAKTWELLLECGHEESIDATRVLKIHITPRPQSYINYLWIIMLAVSITIALVLTITLLRKQRGEDLLRVLTEVDIEILKFLKTKGGKALQKEIVASLNLPKTTVHRHLKKLQKYGVIEIERLGTTNLVKLTKKLKI